MYVCASEYFILVGYMRLLHNNVINLWIMLFGLNFFISNALFGIEIDFNFLRTYSVFQYGLKSSFSFKKL